MVLRAWKADIFRVAEGDRVKKSEMGYSVENQ